MKILLSMFLIGGLAAMAPASAVEPKNGSERTEPEKVTDRSHPDFIRCRLEPIIGSLARKRRVCMTNAQWTEFTRTGSRYAQQFIEDMQVGGDQNGF